MSYLAKYRRKNTFKKSIYVLKMMGIMLIVLIVPIVGMWKWRDYDYKKKQAQIVQDFLARKDIYEANSLNTFEQDNVLVANIDVGGNTTIEELIEVPQDELTLLSDANEDKVSPIVSVLETPTIETVEPIVIPATIQTPTPIPTTIPTPVPTPIVSEYATIEGDILTFPDEFTITYYCPCKKCCGQYSYEVTGVMNSTASGTTPVAGRTIAVCPDQIPYGTTVIINGHEYVAEDCGGAIGWNKIDIYCNTHEEALQGGRHKAVVSIKR